MLFPLNDQAQEEKNGDPSGNGAAAGAKPCKIKVQHDRETIKNNRMQKARRAFVSKGGFPKPKLAEGAAAIAAVDSANNTLANFSEAFPFVTGDEEDSE
jgi:hypothetical protein